MPYRDNSFIPSIIDASTLLPREIIAGLLNKSVDDPVYGNVRLDVRETDGEYVIEADLPGVPKEKVDIDFEDGVLTISASRDVTSEQTSPDGKYIHRERRTGIYRRSVSLSEVQPDAIRAEMKDGVLLITCPKVEPKSPKSRKIQID
ncbi:MAG: Hsp20/alpha crystallin family protein [Oscillospiraceae bacterium]|jgi:HSP20 family protein|nr:Hsp20/alpha crystallin family protein [Oscillospiraceae bacterium]